jgi:predicted nucleic acid-binding protein
MIVYVESNFLLELAYLQETNASCEALLQLAETGRIGLVLPAFCVTESRMARRARTAQRGTFNQSLQPMLRELARSEPFAQIAEESKTLVSALIESGEADAKRLDIITARVHALNAIEPVTQSVVDSAVRYERDFSLSPQDAVVLAAVIEHAAQHGGTKCFLNRNSKDFANPDVYDALEGFDCKLLVHFSDGLGYVQSVLNRGV